jgi:hypothetical protein
MRRSCSVVVAVFVDHMDRGLNASVKRTDLQGKFCVDVRVWPVMVCVRAKSGIDAVDLDLAEAADQDVCERERVGVRKAPTNEFRLTRDIRLMCLCLTIDAFRHTLVLRFESPMRLAETLNERIRFRGKFINGRRSGLWAGVHERRIGVVVSCCDEDPGQRFSIEDQMCGHVSN